VNPGEVTPQRSTGFRAPGLSFVIGCGFALWGLHLGLRALSDNSFFTHLATGRLILDRGGIPRTDPYSFTAHGHPWVVQSWLASIVYGVAERIGGATGIRVLIGLATALLAALVWRLSALAKSLIPRVVLSGVVVAIGSQLWSERPLLFGLLLLACLLLLVQDDRWPVWLAVPIFWVWVNVHGSFPLGVAAVAAILVGERLDGNQWDRRLLQLLGWSLAGTLVGAIGPLGPHLLVFPAELLSKRDILRLVVEWQSPDFNKPYAQLFLVELVIAILALARRPRYRAAIPLVVFGAAALLALRNIAVASIVLVPGTAACLEGLGTLNESRNPKVFGACAALLGLLGGMLVLRAGNEPDLNLADFPVAGVSYLDRSGFFGDGGRLVTDDVVGNYLEGVYGKNASVFVDDRYDMYPRPVLEDLVKLVVLQPGWADVLTRRDADAVLWRKQAPLSQALLVSPAWKIVYQDAGWQVACPRVPPAGRAPPRICR
jgi:hypothetical protein